MTRKPKVQRRRVKALTDPKPEFVSLVNAGANMTPFKAVKADVPADAETAVPEGTPVTTDTVVVDAPVEATAVVEKADTHDIAKLVFKKDAFADVAAVKAWLAAGGYEGADAIAEDGDTFVVGEADEKAAKVEYAGVTVYVVERAEPEAKADDEPAVAESAPSNVTEVQPVAKAAEPVVATERVQKSLYQVPTLIQLVANLKWVVSDLSYDVENADDATKAEYEPVIGALKQSAKSMMEGLSTLFGLGMDQLGSAFKAEEAAAVEAPVETPVEPVVEAKVDEPVVETPVEAPVVEAEKTVETPVADSRIDALVESVAKMGEAIALLTTNVANAHNESAAKVATLVEKVAAIEEERQSRKGADADETTPGTPATDAKKDSMRDLTLRAALGIRRSV